MKRLIQLIILGLIVGLLLSGCMAIPNNQINEVEVVEIPKCPQGNEQMIEELNQDENPALWAYFGELYKHCQKIEVINQELN